MTVTPIEQLSRLPAPPRRFLIFMELDDNTVRYGWIDGVDEQAAVEMFAGQYAAGFSGSYQAVEITETPRRRFRCEQTTAVEFGPLDRRPA